MGASPNKRRPPNPFLKNRQQPKKGCPSRFHAFGRFPKREGALDFQATAGRLHPLVSLSSGLSVLDAVWPPFPWPLYTCHCLAFALQALASFSCGLSTD
jgi:hypothetical protein